MTTAIKLTYGLSPNYKGLMLIETCCRKIKTSKSLGRVISSFNKRLFILDLNRMMFYYVADRNSALGSGSDIPLDSITRMYIDTDVNVFMKEDQSWQHGMTILTTKKAIRLKFESRQILDVFINAFNNIINLQTKTPIYEYPSASSQELPVKQPDLYSPKNYFECGGNQESFGSVVKSPEVQKNREQERTETPEVKQKKQPVIFSPSDSEKVMKEFASDKPEKNEEAKEKPIKKRDSTQEKKVDDKEKEERTTKVEKIEQEEKPKKVERIEKVSENEEKKAVRQEVVGESGSTSGSKNGSKKDIEDSNDRQQPEQVEDVHVKEIKAKGVEKFSDLKISSDMDLDSDNVSTAQSKSNQTPLDAIRHVRNNSLSRRRISNGGGINLIGEIKKASQEPSFGSKEDKNSKKNSWDEDKDEEIKVVIGNGRRTSNLLTANKSQGLTRLAMKKDQEVVVKNTVSSIWKDNFVDGNKKEPAQENKKDNKKADDWDDWDKELESQEKVKKVENSWKQPSNEQPIYKAQPKFEESKPKQKVNALDSELSEYQKALEKKTEDFSNNKKAVHNDWDDEW